jgi:hypothetical protein
MMILTPDICWTIVGSRNLCNLICVIDNPPDYNFVKLERGGVNIDEINY